MRRVGFERRGREWDGGRTVVVGKSQSFPNGSAIEIIG